jgi:hypothetical protein
MFIIQTFADKKPRWTQSVDMSGVRYRLYFSWNTRMQAWFVSILEGNGNMLLTGIRLVPRIDLFEKYRASVPGLPPGIFSILDRQSDPSTAELNFDNFGTRFILSYTETGG